MLFTNANSEVQIFTKKSLIKWVKRKKEKINYQNKAYGLFWGLFVRAPAVETFGETLGFFIFQS